MTGYNIPSVKQAQELINGTSEQLVFSQYTYDVTGAKIVTPENTSSQKSKYDDVSFVDIARNIQRLFEKVNPNLSEKERVTAFFDRVSQMRETAEQIARTSQISITSAVNQLAKEAFGFEVKSRAKSDKTPSDAARPQSSNPLDVDMFPNKPVHSIKPVIDKGISAFNAILKVCPEMLPELLAEFLQGAIISYRDEIEQFKKEFADLNMDIPSPDQDQTIEVCDYEERFEGGIVGLQVGECSLLIVLQPNGKDERWGQTCSIWGYGAEEAGFFKNLPNNLDQIQDLSYISRGFNSQHNEVFNISRTPAVDTFPHIFDDNDELRVTTDNTVFDFLRNKEIRNIGVVLLSPKSEADLIIDSTLVAKYSADLDSYTKRVLSL